MASTGDSCVKNGKAARQKGSRQQGKWFLCKGAERKSQQVSTVSSQQKGERMGKQDSGLRDAGEHVKPLGRGLSGWGAAARLPHERRGVLAEPTERLPCWTAAAAAAWVADGSKAPLRAKATP